MQFRNKSDDAREISLDGVRLLTVEQGEAIDVAPELAAGLVLQCGPDGAWEPADDEATAAVAEATTPPADELPTRPADSAPKAEWVAYAEALGDEGASSKTKQQIIDDHTPED